MQNQRIALGLGSNLGNPLNNLRQALHEIKKINFLKVLRVSSIYESEAQIPEGASADWNKNFLNAVVLCQINTDVAPFELLQALKKIEIKMGRIQSEKWAPRLIDLDILHWENVQHHEKDLVIPHPHIQQRPFVLLPLLEVWPELQIDRPAWATAWVSEKPFATKKSQTAFWPLFAGILNITTDSFSDAGSLLTEKDLERKVDTLLSLGSDILDIGAESTRPGAASVSEEVELKNLSWALGIIRNFRKKYSFEISLDCRHAEVIKKILNSHRIDYLNDVTGFASRSMQDLLKETTQKAIVMHSISIPPTAEKILDTTINPCQQLQNWWLKKTSELKEIGIKSERLLFDPGIGFGKSKAQSLAILKNLSELNEIKSDIMIGHSRKSYQSAFSDRKPADRDLETALVTKDLNLAFTQYLRVHDIETQKIALRY